MPFIPHTEEDVKSMLAAIGAESIEELFNEIPAELRAEGLTEVPEGLSEMEAARLMNARAEQDSRALCFAGAGAYEHHIPAAVWEITTRGEFYSAYTPYQAEASQGTLQLLYEYQTMMASLTGMDISNASLYDGASALAEAVLMAIRANRKSKSKKILMPKTVHPNYRKVAHNIVKGQGITFTELDYDQEGGHINPDSLPKDPGDFAALVIPQPNFFGVLEEIDALTNWAHEHNALVIAVVNPTSLAMLKAPGNWGEKGADITCGEGQPLGAPLSSGGPYFGFMACREAYVRQMPGRIIGRTVDLDGKQGFALTLQAREQHIRRSKATSNICTNQGLLVTAATIYMALLGPDGLAKVAQASHANTQKLIEKLKATGNASPRFNRPVFHETVMSYELPTDELMRAMSSRSILPGVEIIDDYPELGNVLLICATETKSEEDLNTYAELVKQITERSQSAKSPVTPKMA